MGCAVLEFVAGRSVRRQEGLGKSQDTAAHVEELAIVADVEQVTALGTFLIALG